MTIYFYSEVEFCENGQFLLSRSHITSCGLSHSLHVSHKDRALVQEAGVNTTSNMHISKSSSHLMNCVVSTIISRLTIALNFEYCNL